VNDKMATMMGLMMMGLMMMMMGLAVRAAG
jgi:hypothetical protein